jgi:hypothetical protein
MKSDNLWDNLADYFNTHGGTKSIDEIESNAADNVFICEPIVLEAVNEHITNTAGQRALDSVAVLAHLQSSCLSLALKSLVLTHLKQ